MSSYFLMAESHVQKGIKILDELKIKPQCAEGYLYLVELYADTGNSEDALKILNKADSMLRQMEMDYWLDRTREVMGRL